MNYNGSVVSVETGNVQVAGSSPEDTQYLIFVTETAPSSLFNISLVFTYFHLEKAQKKLGNLSEFTNSNSKKNRLRKNSDLFRKCWFGKYR